MQPRYPHFPYFFWPKSKCACITGHHFLIRKNGSRGRESAVMSVTATVWVKIRGEKRHPIHLQNANGSRPNFCSIRRKKYKYHFLECPNRLFENRSSETFTTSPPIILQNCEQGRNSVNVIYCACAHFTSWICSSDGLSQSQPLDPCWKISVKRVWDISPQPHILLAKVRIGWVIMI